MAAITDRDKLRAVEREIALRRRVFPRRVIDGRMTREEMEKEIAVMEAIRQDYLRSGKLL